MPLTDEQRRASLKRAATEALKDCAVVLQVDAAIEKARAPKCSCLCNVDEPQWHSSDCDVYKTWKAKQSR